MTIGAGQKLNAEFGKHPVTVKKKLGEGGQGEIYLVDTPQGPMALKWYNPQQSTEEQKKAIRELVHAGAPKNPASAGKRFVWPRDLVLSPSPGTRQFGYIMPLIDKTIYKDLGEVQNRRATQPSIPVLCEISFQTANSYRALHLSGYCYRDISAGNLMFNVATGDVLICDNDNVGVANQADCQVLGTWEYMAPEVILGKSKPSTYSDLHSLAVLLFNLWMWHHPMHGDLECAIRSWDIPAKKKIYGEKPVFIYHPRDSSNRPNEPSYSTVRTRWKFCPPALQSLFTRAFTQGLDDPAKRVTEGEWQQCFRQLKDGVIFCSNCGAHLIWDPNVKALSCWHCAKVSPIPPRLRIHTPQGFVWLLLTSTCRVLDSHLRPGQLENNTPVTIADMCNNPANPGMWGLRNLTSAAWSARMADGTEKTVPPGKAIPISSGLKIQLPGAEADIVA